jgi:hypothetical protein
MPKYNRERQNVTHAISIAPVTEAYLIDQYGAAVDNLVEARDHAAGVVRSLIMRTAQRIAGTGPAASAMMLALKFSWCPSRSYSASRIESLSFRSGG